MKLFYTILITVKEQRDTPKKIGNPFWLVNFFTLRNASIDENQLEEYLAELIMEEENEAY